MEPAIVRTIRLHTDIPNNRELRITLPADVPTGPADVVVVVSTKVMPRIKTFGDFLDSEFVGMWKDRTDIQDGASFAPHLRVEAWKRSA